MTTPVASPVVIAGDQALAEFRQGLTGPFAFDPLQQAQGRLLVQLAVGVGKTRWLVEIIVHALTVDQGYDLVVCLTPRWDILRELLQRLPKTLPRVVLNPRPRKRCGELDAEWLRYEQTGCGLLGRERICGACPLRQNCRWPGQYGSRLRGARLIVGNQAHLPINPLFIAQLAHQTRALNPLVLADESDVLLHNTERVISRQEQENFIEAQEDMLAAAARPTARMREWLDNSRLLAEADTPDLREGRWRFPRIDADWATEVQRYGWELVGPAFRFLGHEWAHFAQSDAASRERLPDGGLRYALPPCLGPNFAIFSGSIARPLARYRLDPNHARPALLSPFELHRFQHPDTRFYNLNMLAGAAKFFPSNADVILDFFAALIARNIREGRRTLLVARKKFRALCRTRLHARLEALGVGPVKIVTGNWKRHDLQDPRTLPLINYGVAGLNKFEHVECAYCLTGYYIDAATLTQAVQDIDPSTDRYPVTVHCEGNPRQRRARVELPDDRETILPEIAQAVLEQKEADVVLQAVGRVRPFTRPREVITFHVGPLPGVRYRLEFGSLAQARSFFGIQAPRQAEVTSRVEQALRLRAQGRSRAQIARELGVSDSTVKRYLKQGRGS
jgi:hypothetical protein